MPAISLYATPIRGRLVAGDGLRAAASLAMLRDADDGQVFPCPGGVPIRIVDAIEQTVRIISALSWAGDQMANEPQAFVLRIAPSGVDRVALALPSRPIACVGPPLLMNALHFVGRTLAVLPRLVDDRGCQELRRIEFADRETIEPRLLPARQAVKLRAPHVPQFDIDAVGAALAEEQDRHGSRV